MQNNWSAFLVWYNGPFNVTNSVFTALSFVVVNFYERNSWHFDADKFKFTMIVDNSEALMTWLSAVLEPL